MTVGDEMGKKENLKRYTEKQKTKNTTFSAQLSLERSFSSFSFQWNQTMEPPTSWQLGVATTDRRCC